MVHSDRRRARRLANPNKANKDKLSARVARRRTKFVERCRKAMPFIPEDQQGRLTALLETTSTLPHIYGPADADGMSADVRGLIEAQLAANTLTVAYPINLSADAEALFQAALLAFTSHVLPARAADKQRPSTYTLGPRHPSRVDDPAPAWMKTA
jgi:hypothetical protein